MPVHRVRNFMLAVLLLTVAHLIAGQSRPALRNRDRITVSQAVPLKSGSSAIDIRSAVVPLSVTKFGLLTTSTGWAASNNRLVWTSDNGLNWKDISPANPWHDRYADVYFLNENVGWVLFAHLAQDTNDPIPHSPQSDWTLYLACTHDSGATWQRVLLPVLNERQGAQLSEHGEIRFADQRTGWIELHHSLNWGDLLTTSDGGQTWTWVKNAPRINAELALRSDNTLFLAGTNISGDSVLFATYDKGRHFSQIQVNAPSSIAPANEPTYSVPEFSDDTTGYLSVTFSGKKGVKSGAVLYVSTDGGHAWKQDRIISNLHEGWVGLRLTTGIVGSTWISPARTNDGTTRLVRLNSGSTTNAADVALSTFKDCAFRFKDSNYGWTDCSQQLSATTDGGATWKDIGPRIRMRDGVLTDEPLTTISRQSVSSRTQPNLASKSERLRSSAVQMSESEAAASGLSQHLGFDITRVPTTDVMQEWWNYSPYYLMGVYLPGSPNRGTDNNLDADWISSVSAQGWGFIPTWFGLQAPSSCYLGAPGVTQFISTDPATANAAGIQQANLAYASAQNLGFDGSTIYLDIENYDANGGCGPEVQAYINGFVSQVHQNGGQVGVYGNPYDTPDITSSTYDGTSVPPDFYWATRGDNRATVWNLAHGESVTLLDTQWGTKQRSHQYYVDNTESWGESDPNCCNEGEILTGPLQIDADIVDSTVVASFGVKEVPATTLTTVTYSTQDEDNGAFTTMETIGDGTNTINNYPNPSFVPGTAAGSYQTSGEYSTGFTWQSGGVANTLSYSSSDPNVIVYGTYPLGTNSIGQVVGYYTDYSRENGLESHGFLWTSSGGFTILDVPNESLTQLWSINDAGWILASYWDFNQEMGYCALFKPLSGGNYGVTPFNELGGECQGGGINGIGQIAGEYYLRDSESFDPFFDDPQSGTPGDPNNSYALTNSGGTWINSINNNGLIVGYDDTAPLLITPSAYVYLDASDPTAYFTGINDDVEITGASSSGGLILDIGH